MRNESTFSNMSHPMNTAAIDVMKGPATDALERELKGSCSCSRVVPSVLPFIWNNHVHFPHHHLVMEFEWPDSFPAISWSDQNSEESHASSIHVTATKLPIPKNSGTRGLVRSRACTERLSQLDDTTGPSRPETADVLPSVFEAIGQNDNFIHIVSTKATFRLPQRKSSLHLQHTSISMMLLA